MQYRNIPNKVFGGDHFPWYLPEEGLLERRAVIFL